MQAKQQTYQALLNNIQSFKIKYLQNKLIKGVIISASITMLAYITVTGLEHFNRFDTTGRLLLLLMFCGVFLFFLIKDIILPIKELLQLHKSISDEQASKIIGQHFPEIADKLVNTLQLISINSDVSDLIEASIQQRSKQLNTFHFASAVDISENRKYLKYIYPPFLLIICGLIFYPSIFSDSSDRIIHFNSKYSIPAPFQFKLNQNKWLVYKNEPAHIELTIDGDKIPENANILFNDQSLRMKKNEAGKFTYTFNNVQRPLTFQIEAAGFYSIPYEIQLQTHAELEKFSVQLNYPKHTQKKAEAFENVGNLSVPEGTKIEWSFSTRETSGVQFIWKNQKNTLANDPFQFTKTFTESGNYQIILYNQEKNPSQPLSYSIQIQKDLMPGIEVEEVVDSVLFNYIQFGGLITDDYGFTKLAFVYEIDSKKYSRFLRINTLETSQSFIYTWNMDSIFTANPNKSIKYYLEVYDNDGVNGPKKSTSIQKTIQPLDYKNLQNVMKNEQASVEKSFEKINADAQKLQSELEKVEKKLKTQKQLSWQDKKTLEELIKKQNELQKNIEEFQKKSSELNQQQNKFNPTQDPALTEKLNQIQKLMDQLLDEETKKKLETLEKLMEKNASKEQIEEALKKLNKNDQQLKEDLERTLELYKKAKIEKDIDDKIKALEELEKKQEELSKKTQDNKQNNSDLSKEQEAINKEFESVKKDLENIQEENQELKNPMDLDDADENLKEAEKELNNSKQSLDQNQKKKAQEAQNKAQKNIKEAKEKLQQQMKSGEMAQNEENMKDLRQLLDNLTQLSFEQERIMKEIKKVNQTDPRYIELSKKQVAVKNDSELIKDSLYALAKRVPQIESFVTKEVHLINEYTFESLSQLKARRPDLASASMQYTMTSINNLALMLSDVLKQMQNDMMESMPMMSNGSKCNKPKPGQGKPKPKPGEISKAQQELNQKMEQLRKSGATGKQLSEELAKLAAEQEQLRNAIQEIEKQMGSNNPELQKQIDELKSLMEKTEKDLVNKQLSTQTIERQKQIETRLLETEKSMNERDWDNKREAEQNKSSLKSVPPSLEKYLKLKEQQEENNRQNNLKLSPFYKRENELYYNFK
jgi:uncharacterized glyoxalase superfamily protein PhnB